MTIADRLQDVRDQIARVCQLVERDPAEVDLLPVSKRHSIDAILEARASGLEAFGENRVQELITKSQQLAEAGISWHMIGSLQTNKVNQIVQVPGLVLIQSLDRVKLADALQLAAFKEGRQIDVLLQTNATGEDQKHGVMPADAPDLLAHLIGHCPNLQPVGVMAMGPLLGDPAPVFKRVASLHEDLRERTGLPLPIASMGMTGDMTEAVAAGSTMVRVGTGVFGSRPT